MAAPNGEPVDLTGEWGSGEWFPTPGTDERTFILHRGACVWAVVMDAEFRATPIRDRGPDSHFHDYGIPHALGTDALQNALMPQQTSRRMIGVAATGLLLSACAGQSLSPSPTPSEIPTATTGVAGSDGPSWCDPTATVRLLDPNGTQVALPFEWESDFLAMTYYLRQVGDCVWMTGHDETDDPDLPFITQFVGRLGPDFRIVGEFADLNGALIIGWDHGSIAWQITFEDDAIVLVEDRSAEQPPGCLDSSVGACPDLRRLTAR